MTDKLADTNRTRMEHLSLLETTIGSKDIAICSARLGNRLISESNQSSASIDRQIHGDQYLPFGIRKSSNGMSVDFG